MANLDFWRGNHHPFFKDFRDWNRSLERLAGDDFWRRPMQELDTFNPSCELTEEKDQFVARLEVPGIPKEAIKIDLQDNVLTISGEKKEEHQADGKRRYTECTYGSFLRSFTLPSPVNAEKVSASYNHGVLTVAMAKAEGARGRQIAIK